MLADTLKKVNAWCREHSSDIFVAAIIFLTGLSGFGLGRLSVEQRLHVPISITTPDASDKNILQASSVSASLDRQKVVASKNGGLYHYAWCPGALKIKEENKVWFSSKEEAQKAGLKPAGNCPGL